MPAGQQQQEEQQHKAATSMWKDGLQDAQVAE
jgi:hypothetical protein